MASLAWHEVTGLIGGAGPARMATSSPDGEPHVAVVFAVCDGGYLWAGARERSAKVSNLRRNPRAALLWEGNSAETYLWGEVEIVDDPATKRRLWDSGLFPYDLSAFFGSADASDWVLLRVTPARVVAMVQAADGLRRRSWSATAGDS